MIKKSIETGNTSHAYIFAGPAGVGKMVVARAFACTLIAAADRQADIFFREGIHPDLMVIEKTEGRTTIAKEQITHEMEPWLELKPSRAQKKVVIIRDAHLMRPEAANALLKTLEEPPLYALLILITDENNLLETIVSRCQILTFNTLKEAEIEKLLVKEGVNAQLAQQAAKLGQGSPASALQFAKSGDMDNYIKIARDIVGDLSKGERLAVFHCAEKIETQPELICGILETMLRDILIYSCSGQEKDVVLKVYLDLLEKYDKIDVSRGQAVQQIDELRRYYKRHVNSLLVSTNISYKIWEALN
jgi:DNA polymerase-3 subunit delta'